SETIVNSTRGNIQKQASDRGVATSNSGDYVVTWASYGQDGSGWGVYAQRFDHNGIAQGGEFRVNTTTSGDQLDPAVAMDAAGNFLISWTSIGQDGSGAGIYARRFSASGIPLGSEFRVNTTTANDQKVSTVALDALGNAVISWSSKGTDAGGFNIYAQ